LILISKKKVCKVIKKGGSQLWPSYLYFNKYTKALEGVDLQSELDRFIAFFLSLQAKNIPDNFFIVFPHGCQVKHEYSVFHSPKLLPLASVSGRFGLWKSRVQNHQGVHVLIGIPQIIRWLRIRPCLNCYIFLLFPDFVQWQNARFPHHQSRET